MANAIDVIVVVERSDMPDIVDAIAVSTSQTL
jgi:hypothetical protein